MKEFVTYLNFDGNCRQAMEFYAKCLDAQLYLMPYSEGPMKVAEEAKSKILHARLDKTKTILMASDCAPGMPLNQGNNFSISIDCENREEVDSLIASISEKGKVVMAAQDMFWGAYFGMITDQFGINWMFNFQTPQQT